MRAAALKRKALWKCVASKEGVKREREWLSKSYIYKNKTEAD